MLAGRQALIFRARDLAGQKAAFARPFFLGARQLAVGWRLVGHELLVPVHRGGILGAAHGGIDDQRQADDTSEIVVEPLLMPDATPRLPIEPMKVALIRAGRWRHQNAQRPVWLVAQSRPASPHRCLERSTSPFQAKMATGGDL